MHDEVISFYHEYLKSNLEYLRNIQWLGTNLINPHFFTTSLVYLLYC